MNSFTTNKRQDFGKYERRINFLIGLFFVFLVIILSRLFYIQVIRQDEYKNLAGLQHLQEESLIPKRGDIFVQDKNSASFKVALNKESHLFFLEPVFFDGEPRQTSEELIKILGFEKMNLNTFLEEAEDDQLAFLNKYLFVFEKETEEWQAEEDRFNPEKYLESHNLLELSEVEQQNIIGKINTERRQEKKESLFEKLKIKKGWYKVIEHYVDPEKKEKIEQLGLNGLSFSKEPRRFYPSGDFFSQLTGFVGYRSDNKAGQYGLEEYFEDELKGEVGFVKKETTPGSDLIASGEFETEEAIDGRNIHLTLDKNVQYQVCDILKESIKDYEAEDGTVIVQDVQNGKIIAMCSYPNFDANKYWEVGDIKAYTNPAISYSYEPGSIFKPLIMGIAIDTASVEPNTIFHDTGTLKLDKYTITNADNKKYDDVDMTAVLENSINTGMFFVGKKTGREDIKKYISDFGFGSKLGIELPGEMNGNIKALDKKSDIFLATTCFGQGISVTPLQMTSAFSALVGGGILYKPSVVENGEEAQIVQRVVSSDTSNVLKAMLLSVVKNGHAGLAAVPGYQVGGKTGTAEIAGSGGGYTDQYNHSFIGFGPFKDTRFTVFVKLGKPQNGRYSASTAAPTFGKVMKFLFDYYQVPKDIVE
jgi:cell division protein FtsI/penicillin-binding protein 2